MQRRDLSQAPVSDEGVRILRRRKNNNNDDDNNTVQVRGLVWPQNKDD